MNVLMQKIQASRNMPDPVLYGGDLQDNTDIYYKPNDLASQEDVPAGPAKIFRNYGATAVIDERPSLSLGLQVPRNPQQIALNEYFGRQRLQDFAAAQSRMNVSEQLAKQAELMANNLIRDEVDRRAGIRRTVLEATGFTPAQIEQEMAANALGGINQNALDIRDKQVQDAVNLYYNVHNIPLPVTTPGGVTGAIAATVPTAVAGELPATEAEAAVATDIAGLGDGEGEAPQFVFGGPDRKGEANDLGSDSRFDGQGGASNAAAEIPEESRGIAVGDQGPLPDVARYVEQMDTQDLIDYIVNNGIPQEGLLINKDGSPKQRQSKKALKNAVIEHLSQATRLSMANKQGIGSGK